MSTPPSRAETRRLLNIVLVVAILDALLLVPLVIAAARDAESTIDVLGPIHGIGFVALLALTARGVQRGMWGWWFPIIVIVTAGPPGSIAGDVIIRRQLR